MLFFGEIIITDPIAVCFLYRKDQHALDSDDNRQYYRAEVHLSEGGQDYDIMGWSRLAVINDVIDHYHKHQHFLHLLK